MTEEFLYYLWQYQLLEKNIICSTGEDVSVVNPGSRNHDSGPDFINAKIKFCDTLWVGNVEIHLKSSDWNHHKHDKDEAYSNVILHVVLHDDHKIYDSGGNLIPAIEIMNSYNELVYQRYEYFLKNKNWIPCEKDILEVGQLSFNSWLERILVERFERKMKETEMKLNFGHNNWEDAFYQVLASNFGFKVNEQPFLMLAKSLPFMILQKHRTRLHEAEALLYGQAGMLNETFEDAYPNILKETYTFLRNKFSLVPIGKHLWKYLRLRPSNFPTIRLSQFATLFHHNDGLFSAVLDSSNINELTNLFGVPASDYWNNHYVFDKSANFKVKHFGKSAIHIIIINTVVQFLFLYGKYKRDGKYRSKAIQFLLDLPPEENATITGWKNLGIVPVNAFESQALLELKGKYCNLKKCLNCTVGVSLLRPAGK